MSTDRRTPPPVRPTLPATLPGRKIERGTPTPPGSPHTRDSPGGPTVAPRVPISPPTPPKR